MESQPPASDTRLLGGRYRLVRLLGRGGMAEVLEAHDERLGRQVAVKILRPELRGDRSLRRRFEAEARSAARLSHPNVVAIFDVGEDGDTAYLVMELLGDETLADRLRTGPLSEEQARRWGLDILAALGAAHGAGILHRDVKPANVLFGADGAAILTDFGIAKALEERRDAEDLTATSLVLGTPAYLAPERAEGGAGSPASDLWSVGAVLYEALSGVKPFAGRTPLASAMAARQASSVPLDALRPGLSPALVAVVDQALRPRPEDRFASAAAMAAALRGARGPEVTAVQASGALPHELPPTITTTTADRTAVWAMPTGDDRPPTPPSHRSWWLAAAVGMAAVAAGITAVLLTAGGGTNVPPRHHVTAPVAATTSPPPTSSPSTSSPSTTSPTTSTPVTTTTLVTATSLAPSPVPGPPTGPGHGHGKDHGPGGPAGP